MPTAAYDDVYHNFANPETRWTHLRMKVKYISESKAYEGRTWEHPQYTTSQKGVLSGITSLYFFFFLHHLNDCSEGFLACEMFE